MQYVVYSNENSFGEKHIVNASNPYEAFLKVKKEFDYGEEVNVQWSEGNTSKFMTIIYNEQEEDKQEGLYEFWCFIERLRKDDKDNFYASLYPYVNHLEIRLTNDNKFLCSITILDNKFSWKEDNLRDAIRHLECLEEY